jgi:multidrug efflux system membrane fusion protein
MISARSTQTISRVALTVVAAAAAGALIVVNPLSYISEPETVVVQTPRSTSVISISDLSRTVSAEGQLEFGSEIVVSHVGAGTLTWVATEGSVATEGDVIYRVDNIPVVLLDGTIPAYRSLTVGDVGPDVAQLEQALVDLGYDAAAALTVDDTYTTYTATVVERWQSDMGVEITGDVDYGSVIFASGAVNIGAHSANVGDQLANGPVLSVSSSIRQIKFGVEVGDLDTIQLGTPISVRLPDRSQVEASVTALVSSEGAWTATAQFANTDGLTKVGVVPVTVQWTEELATMVLTVPGVALTRVDDGSYNLEILNPDDTTDFVPVEIGMNSGSTVQIFSDLPEGTVVVAP